MDTNGDSVHLLHVDDDPDVNELTREMLERSSDRFEVGTATTAAEGLDRLSEQDFDCVISDYDMPGLNGIEFLQAVRERDAELPFILFTGKGSEEVASEAISAGVTDYVQKQPGKEQYELLANRVKNAVTHWQAERTVERTQRRFQTLVEETTDVILVVDPNGTITYATPSASRILGRSPDDLVGTDGFDPIHRDDRERVMERFGQLVKHPEARESVEFRYERPDGSMIWVEARGRNLLDDPVVEGLVVYVRDTTARKEYELSLEREERRYQAIFNDPNILVGLIEPDGTVLDINQTAMEYIEATHDDVTGEKFWETPWFDHSTSVQDDVREWIDQAASGEYVDFEVELADPDGDPYVIDGVFRPVTNDDGEVVSLIISDRDVTERTERERELERYKAYLEESRDIITVFDASGTVKYESPAVTDILGYEQGDLVGQDAFELIHPDDVDEVAEKFAALQAEPSGTATAEYRFKTATGDWRWLEARGTNQLETDPINGIVTTNRDISKRKEHERQLREEQQFTRSIFRSLPDPLYAFDDEGYPIRWNDQFERVSGYSRDEIGAMHVTEFVPDDEIDVVARNFEAIFAGNKAVTVETEVETKSGDRIPYELTGSPLEDADGDIRGMTGVGRDITERKSHEHRLESLNRAARELFTAETPTEVTEVSVDVATDILECDACAIYLFDDRLSASEPVAVTDEWPHDSDEIKLGDVDFGKHAAETGEPLTRDDTNLEAENCVSDSDIGSELYLPLGEYGTIVAGSMGTQAVDRQDELVGEILANKIVTALKQAERIDELARRERRLTRQNERLDQFASVVSHDLRNPLNVAQARLELALDECESDQLDHIKKAHERMSNLIDDILAFAREGEVVTDLECVHLEQVVKSCWNTVETKDANLKMDVNRPVLADSSRLKRVFENLIRNAVEHADSDVTIRVGDQDDGFYVEDDGPGIPESDREDVFVAGYTTNQAGTGFGLSIVKQIIEAHGWDIGITDGSDGGTRFEITDVSFCE